MASLGSFNRVLYDSSGGLRNYLLSSLSGLRINRQKGRHGSFSDIHAPLALRTDRHLVTAQMVNQDRPSPSLRRRDPTHHWLLYRLIRIRQATAGHPMSVHRSHRSNRQSTHLLENAYRAFNRRSFGGWHRHRQHGRRLRWFLRTQHKGMVRFSLRYRRHRQSWPGSLGSFRSSRCSYILVGRFIRTRKALIILFSAI